MYRQAIRHFLSAILVFIILSIAFFTLNNSLESRGFDTGVLAVGNAVLFTITFISFLMCLRALHTRNNHFFFRLIYGSFILKLVILAATAFIYIMSVRENVNKPALFFCMGLYVIYTFIEVNALIKITKRKKPVTGKEV